MPTAAQGVAVEAVRNRGLWNTSAGDDVPALLDIDGVRVVVVEDGRVVLAGEPRPGTILSRSELERQIYGWNEEVESNAIEFLIHTIRKKLGATAIRNVRGVGWMVDRTS